MCYVNRYSDTCLVTATAADPPSVVSPLGSPPRDDAPMPEDPPPVYATKPLNYNGNLIEDICLTFRDGRVVAATASRGEELLQQLIATDDGSAHLGEVALVPFDSPISRSGILFFNTLFDENAACHLALGKAYPTCLQGGEEMDSVTLLQHGVNDSLIHEDFMIGSRDLSITGRTKDGKELPIFRDGNFVDF